MNIAAFREKLSKASASGQNFIERSRGWTGPLWNVLTMGLMEGIIMPKKALSVSLERGCTWVAVGSRFMSRIKITGVRKYALEEGRYASPESLASSIALAVKELRASKEGLVLGVPREWTIIKLVELPETVKETITDVIAYELDRLTPFSADAALYDFKIVSEEEGKLKLIIVAMKAEMINQYIHALKREGFEVEKVTANIANLTTLCSYMGREPDMICFEADGAGYEGALVKNNVISASVGGTLDLEERGDGVERITEGLGQLLEAARGLDAAPPVFLSVRGRPTAPIEKSVQAGARVLNDDQVRKRFNTQSEELSLSASGGLLESLWNEAGGLNLLNKGVTKHVKIPWWVTVVLLVLLASTLVPWAVLPLRIEEKRLLTIEKQISARKEEVKKVEDLRKAVEALEDEVSSIEDFKESRPMTLILLKELTRILPKTAWLTRARFADKSVDIEGYANSASEILPKLEASKYFQKVEFASPTVRDTRLNADRFVIKMELENISPPEDTKDKPGAGKEKEESEE